MKQLLALILVMSATFAFADEETTKPSPSSQPTKTETASRGFEGSIAGEAKELNGITFHWCPAGSFTMGIPGATDNKSPVNVTLSTGFWLGETEMTEGQYKKLISKGSTNGNDYPVTDVSYDDAVSYCQKLTSQERNTNRLPQGWKYSLPTEAQWEYACRAETKTKYWFGDNESQLGEYAWYDKNSSGVNRVGQKPANKWGLKDTHGNVWEWCSDWYGSKLRGGRDPVGAASGSIRVVRGGCWFSDAADCRSAFRGFYSPGHQSGDLGFRLALVPE